MTKVVQEVALAKYPDVISVPEAANYVRMGHTI
jgi:hypothetical protein